MDSFPNLHTDLSYLQSNRILEILHGRYGPGRALFGSSLPRQSAGAARVPVIDSHAHYQPPGHATGAGYMMREGDVDSMVRFNGRLGVGQFCVAPWIGIWSDCEAGNLAALAMKINYPGRVHPYLLIDPNYVEDIEGTARKFHLEHSFPGIKMFYYRTKARYNDPMFGSWWELAQRHRLFALMDNCAYPTFLRLTRGNTRTCTSS